MMRAFLSLLLVLVLALPAVATERVDLELVLAADGSGSIDEEEFRLQRQGYAAAVLHPEVLGAIRSGVNGAIAIALLEWGAPESPPVVVDWHRVSDRASAEVFAAKLLAAPRQAHGYNSISNAIHRAAEMLRENAFDGLWRVIDVSGDGPQIGGRPLEAVRRAVLAEGITINALVVKTPGGGFRGPGGMSLEQHYKLDMIGGPGAFVKLAETRQNFAEAILAKMLLEISGLPAPAMLAFSERGGTHDP